MTDLESPELSGEDARHLLGSLRLRAGEMVAAADGDGAYRGCRLACGQPKARDARTARSGRPEAPVPLEPVTPIRRAMRSLPEVTVGLSVGKGDRTEWAVAKLVEVGVDRIVPLVCDRTVVRPGTGRSERLQRIAREAAMQSRRLFLPAVGEQTSLEEAVSEIPERRCIALAEPGGEPLSLGRPIVLVGPEGGWSAEELSLGLPAVGLGDTVLRIETAAVVAGALLVAMRTGLVRPGQGRYPA